MEMTTIASSEVAQPAAITTSELSEVQQGEQNPVPPLSKEKISIAQQSKTKNDLDDPNLFKNALLLVEFQDGENPFHAKYAVEKYRNY
ncbi:unnamed protein product, partial [Amoebophrya sp. A25]|eukprot:GSA25T00025470001.1